jgi:hypothetical protein
MADAHGMIVLSIDTISIYHRLHKQPTPTAAPRHAARYVPTVALTNVTTAKEN